MSRDVDVIRGLVRRAAAEHPGIPRSALGRTARALAAQGRLTGNDAVDIPTVVAETGPIGRRMPRQRYAAAWMHPERWPTHVPLVDLELTCDTDDGLAESWTLPAPDAALVASNWALRLALAPGHDALDGYLTGDGPLFLYDGAVTFSCAAYEAEPSAWAHNFDPHSRDGGSELRQDFAGIAVALRRRLARPTGTVLQEVAGKPLTIYHSVYMPEQHAVGLDVDPDAPAPDRVGGAVDVQIADQTWRHVEDDLMTAVRDVGGWVAAALGGPGCDLISDDPFDPLPGKVSFSWHAYHSSVLRSEPEVSA